MDMPISGCMYCDLALTCVLMPQVTPPVAPSVPPSSSSSESSYVDDVAAAMADADMADEQ